MAIKIYRGDAVDVAQVWTVTPAMVEIGDIFTLTINGKTVSFTATAATVANVTAGLATAWNDALIAEFAEVTASDQTTYIKLLADTARVPFSVTSTTSNALGGSVTIVETTPGVDKQNEVQKIELVGTYSGGTFTLTIDLGSGNETTAAIAYNASAAAVQTAIEALASVTAGDVVVTGGPGPSTAWFVNWAATYAAVEVNEFTIDGTLLTGGGDVEIETTTEGATKGDELNFLHFQGVTAGTYTFSYLGETTSAIAYNATAATIQTAVEALSSIGSGNIVFTGGPMNGAGNYLFAFRFAGALAGINISGYSMDFSNLTYTVAYFAPFVSPTIGHNGGASTRDESQLIDLKVATAGTFTLNYAGQTTAAIAWNASDSDVEAALAALSNLSATDLDVHSENDEDGLYVVEFTGTLADTNVAQITVGAGNLTSGATPTVTTIHEGGGTVSEIQTVKIHGTGGTFTLTYSGQTTAATAWNASAATVDTNLTALSNITDVTVTGSGTPADPYVVTFVDPSGNVAEMTGDASSLTGGNGNVTETVAHNVGTDEVQTVTIDSGATGGTFTLSFEDVDTSPIAYNALAAAVETALEALSTIDGISVAGAAGGPYTVTFDVSPLAKSAVALLVGDGALLVGGTGTQTLTIAETTRSGGVNHFDSARNWSGNRVPDSGDTIYLEDGSVGLMYGLRQRTTFTADAGTDVITFASDQVAFVTDQILRVKNSGGALPAGLSADTNYFVINLDHLAGTCQLAASSGGAAVNITSAGSGTNTISLELEGIKQIMRWTADAGLPQWTTTEYRQYRPDYFEIGIRPGGAKQVLLGVGDGSGSQLLKIDTGDYQTELEIHNSGGSREAGLTAIRYKNTNSSSNIKLLEGELGLAMHAGEAAALNKITMRGGILDGGNETGTVSVAEIDKTNGTLRLRNVTINGNLSV